MPRKPSRQAHGVVVSSFIVITAIAVLGAACDESTRADSVANDPPPQQASKQAPNESKQRSLSDKSSTPANAVAVALDGEGKVSLSSNAWKKRLTSEQFYILREAGTERAFSGEYWDHKGQGTYVCAGCGQPLYASVDKFKSGTGWPSYTRPVQASAIDIKRDVTFGMVRKELLCSRCGGHLGHIFDDGPEPTGERHCINSASLLFEEVSTGNP